MYKKHLMKVISLILVTASVLLLSGNVFSSNVLAVTSVEGTDDEEIDEDHILFVRRLYAVVTRQMHADENEIRDLAKKLDDGISGAYDVLYHFYFSEAYRQLCREYNIWVKKILIDNYIGHLDGMTCICDDYYDLDEDGDLSWCYKNAAKHVRCINEQFYSSPTDYYIIADIDNCYVMIFKGSIGQWSLYKIYPMSCGKTGHETPRGNYKVTGKLSYFYSHGSLCYYATQWNGPYYFHSVTYNYNGTIQNGSLGKHISAGCIRLEKSVAEWVYDNIPVDTPVKTV